MQNPARIRLCPFRAHRRSVLQNLCPLCVSPHHVDPPPTSRPLLVEAIQTYTVWRLTPLTHSAGQPPRFSYPEKPAPGPKKPANPYKTHIVAPANYGPVRGGPTQGLMGGTGGKETLNELGLVPQSVLLVKWEEEEMNGESQGASRVGIRLHSVRRRGLGLEAWVGTGAG